MTTRYQKRHYEDVACILHKYYKGIAYGPGYNACVASDFADLFAADNPPNDYCGDCGIQPPFHVPCTEKEEHAIYHYQGFNRAQFLAACGLEATEPDFEEYMASTATQDSIAENDGPAGYVVEPEPELCPKCGASVSDCATDPRGLESED
ncbi:hypothetical protein LCGC14_2229830 [marine sediment metagenome]|uniref:Uncharacterized protein n=1 Tax=marine sediment metagenome TaxID=412755 RepID=A0A0F9G3T3_9ZZZZ